MFAPKGRHRLAALLDSKHLRLQEEEEQTPSAAAYSKDTSQFMGSNKGWWSSNETLANNEGFSEPQNEGHHPSEYFGVPLEPIYPSEPWKKEKSILR